MSSRWNFQTRVGVVLLALIGPLLVWTAVPASAAPPATGSFSLIQMVHTTNFNDGAVQSAAPWDGRSNGNFKYAGIPCTGNAPVNNISTDLVTYNNRLAGSRAPASTRSHPLAFSATKGANGRFQLAGTDTLTVCHQKGGPTPNPDPTPDAQKSKIFFDWTAEAVMSSAEEMTWTGSFTITGGTGIYQDLTGSGSISGYFFCFAVEGCAGVGNYRDGQFTMSGIYSDPTPPDNIGGGNGLNRAAPAPATIPAPSATSGANGAFSVMQMVHTTPFNAGQVANPAPWNGVDPGGPFRYAGIPCTGNAPVNNIATNLTSYNGRLPGSRTPSSTRMHPIEFSVTEGPSGEFTLTGKSAMVVCQLRGGPRNTPDPIPDAEKARITFDWTAKAVKTSAEEVSWAGSFSITGGTGEYTDLRGSGDIAGYFFCFAPEGCASLGQFRDGQFAMSGTYDDPSISSQGGYRMDASDGGIFDFGDSRFFGSTGGLALNKPVVGMAQTPSDDGYWLVASDGGIFSFGDAAFFGSTGDIALNEPIVGMAATPTGKGYWLVASDGGIFSFGDAAFFGSTGDLSLNKPIVGMSASPTGKGYRLVASDGGIFTFGDADFFGSTGGTPLNKPVVGMATTRTGRGYWLVATDGGIFSFGDAEFYGSTGGITLNKPIVGMAATETGGGYWLAATDGGVFAFGDAPFLGSTGDIQLARPVVGIAT